MRTGRSRQRSANLPALLALLSAVLAVPQNSRAGDPASGASPRCVTEDASLVPLLGTAPATADLGPNALVAHDFDHRLDVKDAPVVPELDNNIASTVLIVAAKDLTEYDVGGSSKFVLRTEAYATQLRSFSGVGQDDRPKEFTYPICSSEKFTAQQAAQGACSGVFVAPDKVLTAGHCVFGLSPGTDDIRVVRNFVRSGDCRTPLVFSQDEVYRVAKAFMLRESTDPNLVPAAHSDWAIYQLDRSWNEAVVPKKRLTSDPALEEGGSVYVLGHPNGLSQKYAPGNIIKSTDGKLFYSQVDVYAGSSGSPVFNGADGRLEGIILGTNPDWRYNRSGNCATSICSSAVCKGERILRITAIPNWTDAVK